MPSLKLDKVEEVKKLDEKKEEKKVVMATPRVSEDVRLLTDAKKNLETKLEEKTALLEEIREKHAKEKEELRNEMKTKLENMRKESSEKIKELTDKLADSEAKAEALQLDLEIAQEEKLMLEDEMAQFVDTARETQADEPIPDDPEEKDQRIASLCKSIQQLDMIVLTLTHEKDVLREEVASLKPYKEKAPVLQAKIKDLSQRIDENEELEADLEEAYELISILKEEKANFKAKFEEHKELAEITSELEHAQQIELERVRQEFEAQTEELIEYEIKLGKSKQDQVEAYKEIENYKRKLEQYEARLRELDNDLSTAQLDIARGKERERKAVGTLQFQQELERQSKGWQVSEQNMKHAISDQYKEWVMDFLPTNLVEAETPILDTMASLERCLFYTQHVTDISKTLVQLRTKQLDLTVMDEGYEHLPNGLYNDVEYDIYDEKCTRELLTVHMWVLAFSLQRVQSIACRVPDASEILQVKDLCTALGKIEEHQTELVSLMHNDGLSHATLVKALPKLFKFVEKVWAHGEAAAKKHELGIASGTLLFFVNVILTLTGLAKTQIKAVKRYLKLHQLPEDDPSEGLMQTVSEQIDLAVKNLGDINQRLDNLYSDLEMTEVQVVQDPEGFVKMRVMAVHLANVVMRFQETIVVLKDRGLDVLHGTVSVQEGFYSRAVFAALKEAFDTAATLSLKRFIEAPPPEDARTHHFDLRGHLTHPILIPNKDTLDQFLVVDDSATIPDLLTDVANVSLKVWADLQNQYWDKDPKVPGSPTLESIASSPHVPRAMEIRNSLASVGDLLDKITEGKHMLAKEKQKTETMEKELAESLLEIDKLRTIAENVKEGDRHREEMQQMIDSLQESASQEKKLLVKEYSEAISDLKAQLQSKREDKTQLIEAYKKKKTQMNKEVVAGVSGEEVNRWKSALTYSRKMLIDSKTASHSTAINTWTEKAAAATPSHTLREILERTRHLQAALSPSGMPATIPDVTSTSTLAMCTKAKEDREAVKKQLADLRTLQEQLLALRRAKMRRESTCA
eukprot:TRINITY_DN13306_c0_g1_i2.p1 TRINITY_DN13306_c0_g1~~TRINITY_DN13306_c0_g1_i2.p1  ORF type:complete len:1028 (+),score=370.51 TRINITY_DN13306_c0_g1_i2:399-3482(+)